MFAAIKTWYDSHFTKFLGFVVFALGTANLAAFKEQITATIGAKGYAWLVMAAGVAVIYRGFENSQKKQP